MTSPQAVPPLRFRLLDRGQLSEGPARQRLTERLIALDLLAAAGLKPGQEPADIHEPSLTAGRAYWARRRDFLDHVDGLALATSGSEVVGFSSFSVWHEPEPPIQFHSYAAVRRDYQRSGILTRLERLAALHMVKCRYRRWCATARTVNPAVLQAWISSRATSELPVYPDVQQMPFEAPPKIVGAAQEVCRRVYPGSTLDHRTFVARRQDIDLHLVACAVGVVALAPPRVAADTARFFETHVDAMAGDSVIVVKLIDHPSTGDDRG
jgi:hypothetical protein